MKILFVSHEFTRSGAPIILWRMIERLRILQPDWQISVTGFGDGPLVDEYRRLGIETRPLELDRSRPYHYQGFLEHLDACVPDIVFLNGATLYQEAMLAQWKGHRVIWWVHEGIHVASRDGFPFTSPELEAFLHLAFEYGHHVVFSAQDTRENYAELSPTIGRRSRVIGYGIDIEALQRDLPEHRAQRAARRAELGIGPDHFAFLCVGAIQKRKNQARLVDAFVRLCERLPEEQRTRLHLLLLGGVNPTDPHAQEYQAGIEASIPEALRARIRFLGLQPSAAPYFVLADCHVLVSTNECSPIANLEAMAHGCLCISSKVHGIPEVVAHEERGYLVDPADTSDITSRLEHVCRLAIEAPEELEAIRKRAREFIGVAHTADAMTESFRSLLRDAAKRLPRETRDVPVRSDVNRYLQEELVLRWCFAKGDRDLETHLIRHRVRSLVDPKLLVMSVPHSGLRALLKRVLRRLGLVPILRRLGLVR
ncbi:MAG: glycosyltransferase family 4 protein [Planctomycetota bacterium]